MAGAEDEQTLGGRIRRARNQAGLSQQALGEALGVSRAAVALWEANTNAPTADKIGPLARHVKTTSAYLLDGIMPDASASERGNGSLTPMAGAGEESTLDIGGMPRNMPVLGVGACGKDGAFELSGQTLDYVKRPPRLGNVRDAYALYVSGNSMAPWREPGELVYVHPHAPVRINDYVVVQLKPEKPGDPPRGYIKRLVRRTADNLRLMQFSPRKEISIPMRQVASVHRILDWTELLGL